MNTPRSLVATFQGDIAKNAISIVKTYDTKALMEADAVGKIPTYEHDGVVLDMQLGNIVAVRLDADPLNNALYRFTGSAFSYVGVFGNHLTKLDKDIASIVEASNNLYAVLREPLSAGNIDANTILLRDGTTETAEGYQTTKTLTNTSELGYKYYEAFFKDQITISYYANVCYYDAENTLVAAYAFYGRKIIAVPYGFTVKIAALSADTIYAALKVASIGSSIIDAFKMSTQEMVAKTKTRISTTANKILLKDGTLETLSGYHTTAKLTNSSPFGFKYYQATFKNGIAFSYYASVVYFDDNENVVASYLYDGKRTIAVPSGYWVMICSESTFDIFEVVAESSAKNLEIVSKINAIGEKTVLWIGTSIPDGCKYPQEATENLGLNVINNAIPASGIVLNTGVLGNGRDGRDLSETIAEKTTRYAGSLSLAEYLTYSYENCIIPYIDGTIADCDYLVFDHSYNDREAIAAELSGASTANWTPSVSADRHTWIGAFRYLLAKIYEANPNIEIILCGYVQGEVDIVGTENRRYGLEQKQMVEIMSQACGLPLMKTYNHTGWDFSFVPASSSYISDFNTVHGTAWIPLWQDESGNITEFQMRCMDGVHPYTDLTGKSDDTLSSIATVLLRDAIRQLQMPISAVSLKVQTLTNDQKAQLFANLGFTVVDGVVHSDLV